jgi:hypothetical protein
MATRMQQRRGTAQQWLDADPVLAAGEIGFETDTNEFRIGDGVNVWSDLSPFKNLDDLGGSLDDYVLISTKGQANGVASLDSTGNVPASQLANVLDGAPGALDTLNEIAAALGDDSNFATTIINALDAKAGLTYVNLHHDATTLVHGIADTAQLATKTYAEGKANDAASAAAGALSDHNLDTINVHGIADTSVLVTSSDIANFATQDDIANFATQQDIADFATQTDIADFITLGSVTSAVSDHNLVTTNVHGISNTANLVYAADLSAHTGDTTGVHGIADTSLLATSSDVSTAVADHNSDTTNVHGIADTAALATKAYADQAETDAISAAGTAADSKISTAVAALTKSSVGLGNVDNTSDANKPISTATQTALDLKAPKATPTFTGTLTAADVVISGNLTVSGTTTTVDTQDLVVTDPMIYMGEGNSANLVDLGIVSSFDDGTYQHTGLVRDASASTWKLFKGVTDEPTTTVNFAQGSLDALAVGPLTATTVTPSSGIVFSDGTQTKVGVPSITTFATAISSSATLASGEQDKFVPLTGAVQITLPATGYSTGQSIDFYQASGTGASFASTNSVVGTPGLKFRTTNSVVTAMKTASGWLVFGDLSA